MYMCYLFVCFFFYFLHLDLFYTDLISILFHLSLSHHENKFVEHSFCKSQLQERLLQRYCFSQRKSLTKTHVASLSTSFRVGSQARLLFGKCFQLDWRGLYVKYSILPIYIHIQLQTIPLRLGWLNKESGSPGPANSLFNRINVASPLLARVKIHNA